MRKQLLLIIMALMPMIGYANITTNIDGMIYSLDTYEKTAELVKGGSYSGYVKIPSTVVYGGNTYDVVSIGSEVFKNCTELTSVSIPSSIKTIRSGAFSNCVNLTAVYITDIESWCKIMFSSSSSSNPLVFAHHLFLNGEEIINLVIPDGVEIVEAYSFTGCDLKSVSIPASVTNIGYSAFSNCTKLTSVSIPNSVEYINGKAFAGCSALPSINIPEGVESVGKEVFKECIGLTSVTIGDNVTSIGSSAFEGCSNITKLKFGRSLTRINSNAFKGCASIPSIDLPSGVSEIESGAFDGCSSVTQLTIPSGVSKITSLSFANCISLKKVYCYIEGVPSTADDAFKNSNQENATLYVSKTSLNEYKMISPWSKFGSIFELTGNQENNNSGTCGENLTWSYDEDTKTLTISGTGEMDSFNPFEEKYSPWYEFRNSIQEVILESGVTSIGAYAFSGCEMNSVIIPQSLATIKYQAFQSCYGLNSVNISDLSAWCNIVFEGSHDEELRDFKRTDFIESNPLVFAKHLYLNSDEVKELVIPDNTTSINKYTFIHCSFTSLTIPESVKSIGVGAFWYCTELSDVYCFAENVPQTDSRAIVLSSIDKATLHVPANSVATYKSTIPWSNFKDIVALEEAENQDKNSGTCGENLTWSYDEDTKTLTISGTGEMDNYNSWSSYSPWYEFRNSIQTIIIESGVTSIGSSAFKECIELNSVDIPNSVTSIGSSAFSGCRGLTSLVINDNISRIEQNTFYGCSNLATLIIGKNVTYIADGNFVFCGGIKDIYCYAEDVPYASKAFEGVEVDGSPDGITLHVPANSIKDYQANYPWSNFKTIVAIDNEVSISISASGKTTLTSSEALDFCGFEDLKAYVATGYESNGTIWLTRIKQVPAGTPILIKGEASQTYNVPVMDKCVAHFENMFMGSSDEDLSIGTTTEDGKYKNFYMAGGQFKPASESQTIKAGKCYLQVPASFKAAATGEDQTVKIADSGKSSYAPPVDVDLTNVEGLKAYAATGYDAINTTIWLTRINKIQAGEGVILKGEAGKEYTLPSAATQAYYGNMFVGNIGSKITIKETSDDGEWTNFYLASGSFKKVSGTREIGTNKSYLQLPTSLLVSSARGRNSTVAEEWLMEELETETMFLGSIGGEDEDGTTKIDTIGNESAQPNVADIAVSVPSVSL